MEAAVHPVVNADNALTRCLERHSQAEIAYKAHAHILTLAYICYICESKSAILYTANVNMPNYEDGHTFKTYERIARM